MDVAEHGSANGLLMRDDLLFATSARIPISRNSFRTHVWLPEVAKSGIDFQMRVHDLRHVHPSWPLAGGSDLKSVMDRMGHAQTTQKYPHALPDADEKDLNALDRVTRGSRPDWAQGSSLDRLRRTVHRLVRVA